MKPSRPPGRPASSWTLRPGDLPPEAAIAAEQALRDLEENPVFRAIVFRRRAGRAMGGVGREIFHLSWFTLSLVLGVLFGVTAIVLATSTLVLFYILPMLLLFTILLLAAAIFFRRIPPWAARWLRWRARPARRRPSHRREAPRDLEDPWFSDLVHARASPETFASGLWAARIGRAHLTRRKFLVWSCFAILWAALVVIDPAWIGVTPAWMGVTGHFGRAIITGLLFGASYQAALLRTAPYRPLTRLVREARIWRDGLTSGEPSTAGRVRLFLRDTYAVMELFFFALFFACASSCVFGWRPVQRLMSATGGLGVWLAAAATACAIGGAWGLLQGADDSDRRRKHYDRLVSDLRAILFLHRADATEDPDAPAARLTGKTLIMPRPDL